MLAIRHHLSLAAELAQDGFLSESDFLGGMLAVSRRPANREIRDLFAMARHVQTQLLGCHRHGPRYIRRAWIRT